jgi:hypothetical protein
MKSMKRMFIAFGFPQCYSTKSAAWMGGPGGAAHLSMGDMGWRILCRA